MKSGTGLEIDDIGKRATIMNFGFLVRSGVKRKAHQLDSQIPRQALNEQSLLRVHFRLAL